jgi:hypothetical protein
MKILSLVLGGGEGSRLYPLTANHARPALPLVNGYKIITGGCYRSPLPDAAILESHQKKRGAFLPEGTKEP